MRKLKLLGLLGAVVVAASFCLHIAIAEQRTLDVNVSNQPLPPTVSLSCTSANSDCNTRDSGGVAHIHWSISGVYDTGTLSGNISGSPVTLAGASGTIDSIASSAYSNTFTLTASNEAGSATAYATAIYSCFLKGTQVLLADGSYKNIEDVKVGDTVMSYDTALGTFVGAKVLMTPISQTGNWFYVNETLKVTPGHPIYANGDWKMSDQLRIGDQLMNANGELITVVSIKPVTEDVDVYDLFTEYPNDFFAQNFLVHNEKQGNSLKDKGLLKGMKIAMADGRALPVEQLKAGDKILAYDAKLKRYAISTVKSTATQRVKGYKVINDILKLGMKHTLFIARAEKGAKTFKKK